MSDPLTLEERAGNQRCVVAPTEAGGDRTNPPPGWEVSEHGRLPGPALIFHRPTGVRVHLADAWAIYDREHAQSTPADRTRDEPDDEAQALVKLRMVRGLYREACEQRDSMTAALAEARAEVAEERRKRHDVERVYALAENEVERLRASNRKLASACVVADEEIEALRAEVERLTHERDDAYSKAHRVLRERVRVLDERVKLLREALVIERGFYARSETVHRRRITDALTDDEAHDRALASTPKETDHG